MNFFATHGIRHPLIILRSPQQNRVVKIKKNKLSKAKNMPTKFWGEIVSCAFYLYNRSLTSNLKNHTPYKKLGMKEA